MKTVLLFVASLLLAAVVHAQAPEPVQPAPERDMYLEALRAIGDGRPADASKLLAQMITEGPRDEGGWLDIAMLQCALGHKAEAEALFSDIEKRLDPPPSVRDIINAQRQRGCKNWANSTIWSLQLMRGHDSNVNQGASDPKFRVGDGELELLPQYLPRKDYYTTLAADMMADLGENGDVGFLQAHLRRNDRETDYNSMALLAGIERPWRAGNWRMRSVGMLGGMTLGGRLYQEQVQLQLRGRPPVTLPQNFDFNLQGSATYSHYRTLSNFDALTLEMRGILAYRSGSRWGQLSLGYQNDRGNGDRPGGDRHGLVARFLAHGRLGGKLEGEVDWSRQGWRGQQPYSPGLIDALRHQATYGLRAALIYPLGHDHALQLEYRRVHNNENISIFQYDARQLQLSWRWYGR